MKIFDVLIRFLALNREVIAWRRRAERLEVENDKLWVELLEVEAKLNEARDE